MQATETRYPPPATTADLARRAAFGTGVAVIAVLVAQAVADGFGVPLGGSGPMSPFAPTPLVGATVVAGAAATVVYAAVVRFTDRPVRNFLGVSAVVFALQLLPVFVVAPSMGVTAAGQAVLLVHHVLVAVPVVASMIGVVPR